MCKRSEASQGAPPGAPGETGTLRTQLAADAVVLLDEARWLHSYHLQRSESAQQRAIALIGFAGILIALVPTALPLVESRGQSGLLMAAMLCLALGAISSTFVLLPLKTRTLSSEQLHELATDLMARASGGGRIGLMALQSARNLTYHEDRAASAKSPEKEPQDPPVSLIEAEEIAAGRRMWALFVGGAGVSLGLVLLTSAVAISVLTVSQTQPTPPAPAPTAPFITPSTEPSWRGQPVPSSPATPKK